MRRLTVTHHGGRTITLSVIRHLASHPDQRIGSLLVNSGGPGDSGVAGQGEAFWQGMPVPATCQDEQSYLAKSVALAQRCGVRNGDLTVNPILPFDPNFGQPTPYRGAR